jgi:isoquinoline 1-oxidoreductase subunit alpha
MLTRSSHEWRKATIPSVDVCLDSDLRSRESEFWMATIKLNINGKVQTVDADPDMPLLWVLRDMLELTGTKYGCGMALCGACTVHLNGEAVRSCSTPVANAVGKKVTTIEGLSTDLSHPLQQAWMEVNVSQCGYCQSGQLMQAAALLKQKPKPNDAEIEAAMKGNICRCGTYQRIREAIKLAAQNSGSKTPASGASKAGGNR